MRALTNCVFEPPKLHKVPAKWSAMAAGSFTFVATLEVLPRELHGRPHLGVKPSAQMVALFVGFGSMAALALWL